MKSHIATFFIILFIFSCTRDKGNDNDFYTENNSQQIVEAHEDVTRRINEQIPVSEELEMTETIELKKIEIEDIKEYFTDYFKDGNFQLLEQVLDVGLRKIYFMVHYINNELSIFDTLVGFEIVDEVFQRYLLIRDFRFINIDDSVLLDFSKGYDRIYGFNILYSYPKAAGYTPGLYISTYFDNGNRVADGITIMWNEDTKKFEKPVW